MASQEKPPSITPTSTPQPPRTLIPNHVRSEGDGDDGAASSSGDRTQLRRDLKERHVNMIAFSLTVGIGIFLSSGKVIFLTGPGVAVIVYILMGISIWCVNACLGEMTALFPVKGPFFEFPSRFLDEGVGLAIGWMVWFQYVVVVAAEVTAVAHLFNFKFDSKYLSDVQYPEPTLEWPFGQHTNPAVWIFIFLIFTLVVNLFPVRIFGEIQYVFGCCKLVFIVGLILFNLIINARRPGSPFRYYNEPYSFQSKNFTTSHSQVFTGGPGHLASVWTAMTSTIFSMIGFEAVAITAAENRDLARDESIKLASRKISLRVILLYSLAVFTVGLNVPYTDSYLRDLSINSMLSGQHSVFVIAAVRDRLLGWPRFFNGFYIFSAATCGISTLYGGSRLLHALASIPDIWPHWAITTNIRSTLEGTVYGVPMAAVFTSWLFGLLGFLVVKPYPEETLGRMAANCTVSMLLVYIIICAAYLRFYKCLDRAYKGEDPRGVDPHQDPLAYNREVYSLYPYKTHWQTFRAWYGLITCGLMLIFNGWRSIIPQVSVKDIVACYISIIIFLILSASYHVKAEGYNPLRWRRRASEDLRDPLTVQQSNPNLRRGSLALPNQHAFFCKGNAKKLGEWVWVWLK